MAASLRWRKPGSQRGAPHPVSRVLWSHRCASSESPAAPAAELPEPCFHLVLGTRCSPSTRTPSRCSVLRLARWRRLSPAIGADGRVYAMSGETLYIFPAPPCRKLHACPGEVTSPAVCRVPPAGSLLEPGYVTGFPYHAIVFGRRGVTTGRGAEVAIAAATTRVLRNRRLSQGSRSARHARVDRGQAKSGASPTPPSAPATRLVEVARRIDLC